MTSGPLAILQARTSSRRLPGKVLKPILGKPMLEWQIARIRRAKTIETLVVATSERKEDDPIEALSKQLGIACFRGSLNDVLDRYYQCATSYSAEHVVRLTGDCPLSDPEVIDQVVNYHMNGNYDYTSNALEPTWPHGLDVEAVRFKSLAEAHAEARLPSEREHVTLFLYKNPDRYRIGSITRKTDLSDFRVTVDEPEDFEVVTQIYGHLYPKNPDFTLEDIVTFLRGNPRLRNLNIKFKRHEGLRHSELEDREFLKLD